MEINKIYGNKAIKDAFLKAIAHNRLCHAYLLYGEEGLGKKTFAAWFAKAILCESPDADGGCGVCPSCRAIAADSHPDLFIAPYDKPLPVAAVREIRQRSFVKPNAGRFNVFIIPQADRMEGPSFNALLKVLEEPPGDTVFLLTAADKATTPATISSRCIPVMLSPLSDAEIKAALRENTTANQKMREDAVSFADGNLGKALKFCADTQYQNALAAADSLFDALCQRAEYRFLVTLSSSVKDKAFFERVNAAIIMKLRSELLSQSGRFSDGELIEMISFCNQTASKLKKSYSITLLTNGYCAGLFAIADF